MTDGEVTTTAAQVLRARKGEGFAYGALFIEHCHTPSELPEFLQTVLRTLDTVLRPIAEPACTREGACDDAAESADSDPGDVSAPEVHED